MIFMYLVEFKNFRKFACGGSCTSISSSVFVMRHILLTKGFLPAHSAQDIHLPFREGCNCALVNVSAMVGCRGITAKSNICTLLRVTWSPVCGIFLKLM